MGAAVRVSMVGFDNGAEQIRYSEGLPVIQINSDLSSGVDVTNANKLPENDDICFLGMMKAGPFDIDAKTAQAMLNASNSSGKLNSDVIKRRLGGQDVTRRPRDIWIIDFGVNTTETEAALYEMPFGYVRSHVKPLRDKNRRKSMRLRWWKHGEARPGLRNAIKNLERCLVTPEVAKHRLFVWMDTSIIPDHKLHIFARDDDYFFGVLHSKMHEVWALQIGSTLEDRPSYSSSRTFETFPFPWLPGEEEAESAAYQAISAAAQQLHEEREAWLNPPGLTDESALKQRTLTNLYNALNVFRGKETIKIKAAAGDFAPRLDTLHNTLDKAVCDAYGWSHTILDDEEEILRHLLALNLERAEKQ